MRAGRRLMVPVVALAGVAASLTGCALLDLARGSPVEDAFEYVPADTFRVEFSHRAGMAERLGLDDLDPRNLSEDDLEEYAEVAMELGNDTAGFTELSAWIEHMKDAPLNDVDIEWQISARWGDPDEGGRGALVWKVGDDVDFDALAEDLEEKGYESEGDRGVYSADLSDIDSGSGLGLIGGTYPAMMLTVLLDEDERLVVTGSSVDSMEDIGAVVSDDAESLADDGGMDDLLDLAEDDPEIAWLAVDGPGVCGPTGLTLPRHGGRARFDGLGRPSARALFIAPEHDPLVLLVLEYDSEGAAEDDRDAREALVEDGVDPVTGTSFDDLGDFRIERDGEFLLVEEDLEDGTASALEAERTGGGPGACLLDPDDLSRGA